MAARTEQTLLGSDIGSETVPNQFRPVPAVGSGSPMSPLGDRGQGTVGTDPGTNAGQAAERRLLELALFLVANVHLRDTDEWTQRRAEFLLDARELTGINWTRLLAHDFDGSTLREPERLSSAVTRVMAELRG